MAENEYIERSALIKEIRGLTTETWGKGLKNGWWSHSVQIKDNFLRLIEKSPAADVAPVVHAEWVMIPVNGVARYRCGNIDCCRIIPFGLSPNELEYCPHCGAKMDGGTEKPYKPGINLLELQCKKFTETCEQVIEESVFMQKIREFKGDQT